MPPADLDTLTKDELYDRAQAADVPGRSDMTKAELVEALSSDGADGEVDADADWTQSGDRSLTKRPTWKGAISFGLITIPVGLHTATENRDISFHLLTADDHARVRYQKVSAETGDEVDWDDIVRGFEYEQGRYVVFTDEELEQVAPPSSRAIDVAQFVPAEQIDPVYFDRSYFVSPEEAGAKAYKVLARALSESGRVGVGKVTIRDKERPCTIRVDEDVLVLNTMRWPDEVRVPSFETLDTAADPTDQEVEMAERLIDALAGDFDPAAFSDSHRELLEEAIAAKIAGEDVAIPTEPEEAPATVTDLMEALEASVKASASRKSA